MADPESTPLANYQYEIYLQGLAGKVPETPLSYERMKRRAKQQLSLGAYGYVAGAAGSEQTMRSNSEAFRRWQIVPRMLRDVGVRDLRTELFGSELPAPVLLAPIGVLSIVHSDGELATARAAAATGVPYIHSTAAAFSIEEAAEANGDGTRWFQLYWPSDPDLATSFLRRAEASGYSAIVVTLDVTLLAWRPRDLEAGYLPFLKGVGVANYFSDPVFRAGLEKPPEEDLQAAVGKWVMAFSNPSISWDKLSFLRANTELPILLKGILHPDDARLAVEHGMDGVIVSNHGGRQVDGAIASLDALPAVAEVVPADFPVLLDSGIRSAADAFKALALGARAVLLGRPYMWALALGGEDGVARLVRGFLAELDLTLALSGHTSFSQVGGNELRRV
ncbi:MAG: lactate 2-monooxygenase [Thermoleophilaceae bacterium]|nr:lactate 2-monooxygenase [Thermoleophilaceae bacterium]